MKRFSPRLVVILLVLGAAAIYSVSLPSSWHLDDNHTIVRNSKIGDLRGALAAALATNRGVGDLTFTLNWLVSRDSPAPYRAVNIGIHLANGLLAFYLARRLAANRRRGEWIAAGAAGLFLLHPLATNSVTYVVQRYTALATFFYLASALLYLRGVGGDRKAYLLSVAAALLAARTKEISLTLPLVLLLIDRRATGGTLRRIGRVVPHTAAVAVIPATLLAGRLGLGESLSEALGQGSRETGEIGRGAYLLTQIHVVTTYLRLLAAPYGLALDHDVPIARALDAATIVKGLFLAAVAAIAFRFRRAAPEVALGAGWFFLTLLVESSFFPIRDVLFEHRTYLPSFGFFLAVAALAERGVGSGKLLGALFVGAAIVLGARTEARNRVWKDEVTLWSDSVRKAPGKARPHANLGYAWIDAGVEEKAIASLETAVGIGTPYPEDLVTLAELYRSAGEVPRAEEALRRAIALRPGYGRARRNLAQVLAEKGDSAGALAEAEETTRRDPGYEAGWLLLARLRLEGGDAVPAIEAAREAGRKGARRGEVALLAARAAAIRGEGAGALREIAAWAESPVATDAEDAARVVRALAGAGMQGEAIEAADRAAAALPGDARFPYYAGALRLDSGLAVEAARSLREAVRRAPRDAAARSLLARSEWEAGNEAAARAEAEEALRLDPGEEEALALLRALDSRDSAAN